MSIALWTVGDDVLEGRAPTGKAKAHRIRATVEKWRRSTEDAENQARLFVHFFEFSADLERGLSPLIGLGVGSFQHELEDWLDTSMERSQDATLDLWNKSMRLFISRSQVWQSPWGEFLERYLNRPGPNAIRRITLKTIAEPDRETLPTPVAVLPEPSKTARFGAALGLFYVGGLAVTSAGLAWGLFQLAVSLPAGKSPLHWSEALLIVLAAGGLTVELLLGLRLDVRQRGPDAY
jgi:hypothetical protein